MEVNELFQKIKQSYPSLKLESAPSHNAKVIGLHLFNPDYNCSWIQELHEELTEQHLDTTIYIFIEDRLSEPYFFFGAKDPNYDPKYKEKKQERKRREKKAEIKQRALQRLTLEERIAVDSHRILTCALDKLSSEEKEACLDSSLITSASNP